MLMPIMTERRRLLDEFHLELQAQRIAMPGEIEICGMFGDLMWSPLGEPGGVFERAKADPRVPGQRVHKVRCPGAHRG